jgi:hypothetical protein
MNIFPAVKKIEMDQRKTHDWQKQYDIDPNTVSIEMIERFSFLKVCDKTSNNPKIDVIKDSIFNEEAYQIIIEEKNITLRYSTEKGLFYAFITLEQLMHDKNHLSHISCLVLDDEPELPIRGFMLDISRNKIPSTSTIKRWIDLMARLKYNHFELYVEGMSFLYPSFQETYDLNQTPLTQEEFLELQRYAKKNMIDLVPCHNGLGHMSEWLTKFPDLAELPEGMFMWGAYRKASTLNPLSEDSYTFVKTLYHDAIEGSISPFFHMNLDEPYELGHGKSKEKAKEVGVGQVYLDYLLRLYELIRSWGKTPLVWGDVLNHHPETLEKLPKDLIFVDWGYDYDYPFYDTLKRLSAKNVKFMAAPGTSSWNSMSGRKDDMIHNIEEACHWTKVFNGLGILLTDWGDNGHWQQDIISYPALIFAGLESWRRHSQNRHSIKNILNLWFEDKTESLGKILLDLGTYEQYQPEYLSNRTVLMDLMILHRLVDKNELKSSFSSVMKNHPFNNIKIYQQLTLWIKEIKTRRLMVTLSPSFDWVSEQLDLTIMMLETMFDFIVYFNKELDLSEKSILHEKLKYQLPLLIKTYQHVWLTSNKRGGLIQSIESLELMKEFIFIE